MLEVDGKDIYMTRGDSGVIQVIPKVKDANNERVCYTFEDGDRVIFRLKLKAEDSSAIICEKDCIIDLENNKAFLKLVPEDTEHCEFKKHRYEFELVTSDDFHCTFIEDQPFTIGKELETHAD